MSLRVRTLHAADKAIITTAGDIDIATASVLEAMINCEIERGERFVMVNLSHTTYIDSSGLAVLFRANKALGGQGGRMAVIGCRPSVMRVLRMVCFHMLFEVHEHMSPRLRRVRR
ncbi:MAG: STAS domain-containing protein [Capsulimonadaceae bacterium]